MERWPSQTVVRKLRAIFRSPAREEAFGLLRQYDGPEQDRVQLGLLKLCAGSLDQLRQLAATAASDYRDILAWAEYPRESARSATELRAMDPSMRRAIQDADRVEYVAWLQEQATDAEGRPDQP